MSQDDSYNPSKEVPSSQGILCSIKVTITSLRKKRRRKELEEGRGRGEPRRGGRSRAEEESGRGDEHSYTEESRNHL